LWMPGLISMRGLMSRVFHPISHADSAVKSIPFVGSGIHYSKFSAPLLESSQSRFRIDIVS
jgi:hypothetical protein